MRQDLIDFPTNHHIPAQEDRDQHLWGPCCTSHSSSKPLPRKRIPTSLMRRAFLMTVRALILVRPAPRHDPFESRPLKPFIPVADLNRSWDEAGTQGFSRAVTPGPGFWLRGVDYHSLAARLGSLLAIHRGNRPLQRPRLFTRQPPLSEMGVRQEGRVKRFSRKRDGSSP